MKYLYFTFNSVDEIVNMLDDNEKDTLLDLLSYYLEHGTAPDASKFSSGIRLGLRISIAFYEECCRRIRLQREAELAKIPYKPDPKDPPIPRFIVQRILAEARAANPN